MNWKGLAKWLSMGASVFAAVFVEQLLHDGLPTKEKAYAALTAAGMAMWAYLKQNPLKLSVD